MASAEVRIVRASTARRDTRRNYTVQIDGAEVGVVGDGETAVFPVGPGQHSLKLRIDWAGSEKLHFSVDPGQSITFRCRPGSGPAIVQVLRSFFQRDRYVVLEPG